MSEFRFKFWSPLLNCHCESPKVELGQDSIIRELSSYDKERIESLRKEWPEVKFENFAIECVIIKGEPQPEPGAYLDEGRACLEKALTILRLFKKEIVGFNLIMQPLSEDESYGFTASGIRHYQLWMGSSAGGFGQEFRIALREIEMLQNFFTEFTMLNFNPFALAINYFNKSYIEPYIRDSLLDLMISLENLYLKREDPDLKRYKLGLRSAYVLGQTFLRRKEIFHDIKKAYDFRSQIVHGDKIPEIQYDFLFKIRDYVRESLKVFIRRPSLADGNVLDDRILEGIIKNT